MPRTFSGTVQDPEFRKKRAAMGGAASRTPDAFIRALVKRAPELTENHRAQLRALLASVDGGK